MSESHAADVQAELQQYLNTKNINSLFIAIVENLLIEKPVNPIGYIIEYLHKQYPDQSIDAIQKIAMNSNLIPQPIPQSTRSKSSSGIKGGSEATPASHTKMKRDPSNARKSITSEPEDSEDDDDDYADGPEALQASPSPTRPANRRRSVSAESTDPVKLKAQMSQIASIPKSREVTEDLMSVVRKSLLLRTLDSDQKDLIVKAFSGPLFKSAGQDIIVQGDIGDEFYLLEEGLVDVYVKKKDGPEIKVHTYKHGDAFGELAILYNTPRAATCRAQIDCKLWTLDRVSFKAIVVAAAMHKREMYQAFLQQVTILQSMSPLEIMTLADCLAEEKFADGDIICRQGDRGDYFYIIRDGHAVCWQSDGTGREGIVGELSKGNYFGEIALLTTKPRQATVKAVRTIECLSD